MNPSYHGLPSEVLLAKEGKETACPPKSIPRSALLTTKVLLTAVVGEGGCFRRRRVKFLAIFDHASYRPFTPFIPAEQSPSFNLFNSYNPFNPLNPTVKSPVLTLQQVIQHLNVYSPPSRDTACKGWRPVKLRRTLFA
jgi:hypothetical protein